MSSTGTHLSTTRAIGIQYSEYTISVPKAVFGSFVRLQSPPPPALRYNIDYNICREMVRRVEKGKRVPNIGKKKRKNRVGKEKDRFCVWGVINIITRRGGGRSRWELLLQYRAHIRYGTVQCLCKMVEMYNPSASTGRDRVEAGD